MKCNIDNYNLVFPNFDKNKNLKYYKDFTHLSCLSHYEIIAKQTDEFIKKLERYWKK